jgi:hypothetical protein
MIAKIWNGLLKAAPLRLWAIIGAAVVLTVFGSGLVWIVWQGPWDASQQAVQLNILGWGLWLTLGMIGIIVASIAAVDVKIKGPGDTSFEVNGDKDDEPARP